VSATDTAGGQTTALDSNQTTEFHTDAEGTTHFADQRSVALQEPNNASAVAQQTNVPDASLDIFFSTPRVVSTVSWTAAQAGGTLLTFIDLPNAFYASPVFRSKMDYFQFWRPDIEISFKLNSTVMHYGRLLVCWAPQGSKIPANHVAFPNATGFPWVQISASQQTPVTFTLPYTHYWDMLPVDPTVPHYTEIFRLWIYVAIPLSALNGTPAPVELTTFARVTNHNLMGYSHIAYAPLFEQQGTTESEQTSRGTLSGIANTVAQVAAPLSALPEIGPIASTVSTIASLGASIASALGFSVPANTATTAPMQIRMPRYNLQTDVPQTAVLAAHAEGETVRDYSLVNDTVQAADLLHFAQRPFLIGTTQITTAETVDSIVWSGIVDPSLLNHDSYISPIDWTSYYPSPLAFTARFARYWRGSIRYHFAVIASKFHSCRLVLSYVPYSPDGSYPGTMAGVASTQLVKKVIDINEETEFTLEVPYLQPFPWAQLVPPHNTAWSATSNGALYLTILNPLTAGSTPVNPIYVQIFASAGDDFQWALPSTFNVHEAGSPTAPTPIFQQQGTESDIAPSLSESELRQAVASPFVLGTKRTRIPEQTYQTDEIRSIKSLCNLLAPYEHVTLTPDFNTAITSDPRLIPDAQTWYNPLYNWLQVFRYWRGGVRLATIDSDTTIRYSANVITIPNIAVGGAYVETESTNQFEDLAQSSTTWPSNFLTPVDFVTPWSSNYRCALTSSYEDNTQLMNFGTLNAYNSGTVATQQNFWSSGHDDFLLGWQISPPPFKRGVPTYSSSSTARVPCKNSTLDAGV
jgi:hypothetical protein